MFRTDSKDLRTFLIFFILRFITTIVINIPVIHEDLQFFYNLFLRIKNQRIQHSFENSVSVCKGPVVSIQKKSQSLPE